MKNKKYLKKTLFSCLLFVSILLMSRGIFSEMILIVDAETVQQQGGSPPAAPSSNPPVEFKNPLGFTTVEGVLARFLVAVQGIVAVLAVLMIVVGGIIYIASAGVQSRVELAKKAVTSAVIGLALALAAPAFLKEIYTIMGADKPDSAPVANKSMSEIILNTLNVLLSILGTLAIIMLVVGGIMYMTSGGDDARAETAKKTIQYSIIGLIVALISLVIVTQISNLFI